MISAQTTETLRLLMAAGALIPIPGGVCVDANGLAQPAGDVAGYKSAGFSIQDANRAPTASYDNQLGGDGDLECVVRKHGRARVHLSYRAPSQDMLFAIVYWVDPTHVAVHKWDVANDIAAGYIVRVPQMVDTEHPTFNLPADEVEIEPFGYPFEWDGGVTTEEPTTTTQGT